MARDKTPPGGWLGPPPTEGLQPLAIATKSKKGKWVWVREKQSPRQKKLRRLWEEKMAKADKKGKWRFNWPPKD